MIDVRMRKDHRVHFARVVDKVQVSGVGLIPASLKQPTVQQEAMPVDLQQMLAAGHRLRRAEKGQCRHAKSPTCPPVCQNRTAWLSANEPRRT